MRAYAVTKAAEKVLAEKESRQSRELPTLMLEKSGEPSRTRTCDPLVKSQLLYQLSYRPIYMQRAREGVLSSRMEGILPKLRTIVQKPFVATFSFAIAEPATKSRVVHDDRLRALGAGGDEADLDADLFGEKVDVATSVGGK